MSDGTSRLLLSVTGGVLMLVLTLAVVFGLMRTELVQQYIPQPEPGEDPSMTFRRDEVPVRRIDEPAESLAEPAPAPPEVDCVAEAERFRFQLDIALSCQTDFDCVLGAPRSRCLIAHNVAFGELIEQSVAGYDRACSGDDAPALALDCVAPTTSFAPRCIDRRCQLRETEPSRLNDLTRDRIGRP